MEKRVISFLSSQGRGFSVDLALTKNYLQSFFSQDEVFYRYYVNNEKSKNPLANEGFIRARKEFCRDMTDVFCVDPSLGAKAGGLAEDGRHQHRQVGGVQQRPHHHRVQRQDLEAGKTEVKAGQI